MGISRERDGDSSYVSMGTLFNADASFYRSCLEAFRDLDLQVILAVGGNVLDCDLGPVPGNFMVRIAYLKSKCYGGRTVFVTHGGMNSVSESLSFGVPMVVIPQMSEQADCGPKGGGTRGGCVSCEGRCDADRLAESVLRRSGRPAVR